jgi:hypothetical protein
MSDGWGALPSGRRYGTTDVRATPTGLGLAGPNPGFQTAAPAASMESGGFNNHSFTESFMGLGARAAQGNGFQQSAFYKAHAKLLNMDAKDLDKHYQEQMSSSTYDSIMARASEPPKNVRPKNLNPPSKEDGWGGDAEDDDVGGDE